MSHKVFVKLFCIERPGLSAPAGFNVPGVNVTDEDRARCVPRAPYLSLISQNVSIAWFQKVNSPTKSSTYCLLLLITVLI